MEKPRVSLRRDPPHFNIPEDPETEQRNAAALHYALYSMQHYITAFYDALILFNLARNTPDEKRSRDIDTGSWVFIAARDGAMSIYHYGMAMAGARSSLARCSSLFEKADRDLLRKAGRVYETSFPMAAKMRHAIAHAGELFRTAEEREKNAFSGDYEIAGISLVNVKGAILTDNIINNTFTNTFMGEIVTYDVTEDSLYNLITSRDAFYDALSQID